jgi:hypothetical protein
MQKTTTEWLFHYYKNNYSFFNTKTTDKKIKTLWSDFKDRKPTEQEIKKWLESPIQNYAIVCGKISDLTVIDVDTKNGGDPTPFLNRGFYEVRTPSGGYHFYFKYNEDIPSILQKKSGKGFLKGIDIQSDKKLVFAPPSVFANGAYILNNGALIQPIPDDLLIQILAALEPEKETPQYTPFTPIKNPEMGRPGDIFNALATWEEVLIPNGWTKAGRHGDTQYWRRPGKTDGISGSTNWNNYDLFFCFSTSTDLNPNKGYTKFSCYAALNHNSDYREAARSLVIENYKLAIKMI